MLLIYRDYVVLQGEFVDEGTETHFTLGTKHSATIIGVSSGHKRTGIVHSLMVDEKHIPEARE